ncbi:efflux RND transporter permease subunit [Spiribacter vilamensis]|uniref:Multidrug efflux pump subunit AcrB n=1 Tax=Spiribacter vilamensis TaxID=531306 RepID=A0A4V2GIZ6_9GAMM|nr:efflux RND transporter permease subunit [Spiribacter vilamensis]RZU98315.1 multidrug efflux pump subunit AcrB [Spiribacter vilamensis]TVO60796.1 efflux RND transporter permease subunit [Spiribacter vilamensis]
MSLPNLSAIAVRERSVTLFFLLLILAGGIYAFLSLGRAEDPNFTVRVMMVSAQWPGADVETLEAEVVDPIEKEIQNVSDIDAIKTTIRPGAAYLQVEFEDFVTSEALPDRFYEVRRRMQDIRASLPAGVRGPQVNEDFSDVYFSLMALTGESRSQRERLEVIESLRDRLERVDGVNKAQIFGEREERVFIQFDTAKLQRLGVTTDELLAQIRQFNALAPAGRIETQGATLRLRVDNTLSDPEEIARLPIRIGDQQIRLQDIAEVERGYQDPPQQLIRAHGEDALLLGVVMQSGANGQAFGERLATFVDEQQSQIPADMQLSVLTNQADAIDAAVNLFQWKFLIALLVVTGVSILAIGLKAGVVVGIAIPVTLGATFMVMLAMGMNLDRITLGALIIALGLLVDDAIITIEMMLVKMEEGVDRIQAASYAWSVTAAPMLVGTLVTVSGFVPIGFAKSMVGEYAGNIFWILAISLILSWLVAVIFTPYLGVKLMPAPKAGTETLPPTQKYPRLRRLITFCVNYKRSVSALTLLALVASIAGLAGPVQKQFFPASDRTEVTVTVDMPEGTSIQATNRTVEALEAIAAEADGVDSMSAYVGAGAPRYFISATPEQPSSAFAELLIVTADPAARDALIERFNRAIDQGEFTQARIRVERLRYGPPVTWPVSYRVLGEDPERVRRIAGRVRDQMAQSPYTVDPHLEWGGQVPSIHLDWDEAALVRKGFTPQRVAQQLNRLLDGEVVTELREGYPTVRLEAIGDRVPLDQARSVAGQEARIRALELRNPAGDAVPLTSVADIDIVFENPVLKRHNRATSLAVNADIQGIGTKGAHAAIWPEIEAMNADLPPGYEIQIAGSEEQSAQAQASIRALLPVMVALMLMLIMLQMRSFSGLFITLMTAPLGLIGAVIALLAFGQPFGFVATLGLIGLAGILMRNALILTQQVADNRQAGMEDREAIIEAAVQRARPVMLTAVAAGLAFVPLTMDSFWGPLAYVLIGGVLVGTVVTLLAVPAVYAWVHRT